MGPSPRRTGHVVDDGADGDGDAVGNHADDQRRLGVAGAAQLATADRGPGDRKAQPTGCVGRQRRPSSAEKLLFRRITEPDRRQGEDGNDDKAQQRQFALQDRADDHEINLENGNRCTPS